MLFDTPKKRDEFIKSNLKLVTSRVLKNNKGVFDYDLYQVGSLALVEAVDRFDENRGVMFSTYAVVYIDGYIKKYKVRDTLIRPLIKRNGKFKWKRVISLHECSMWGCVLHDEPPFEDMVDGELFIEWFKTNLDEREREILDLKLNGISQNDIGSKIGLCQSQVSETLRNIRNKFIDSIRVSVG